MNGNPRANGSRGHDPYAALRLVALIAAITGVIVLAAAAFVLSYGGIHQIALSAGVSASMARIFPVIFDAMLVVSCAAVLSLRAANWWHRTYAWLTALVLLAALAAAGAVHATDTHIPRKPAAATIAVLPWVLLLLAFSLLLSMLRQFRRARAAEAGQDVTETTGLAAPAAPGSTARDSSARDSSAPGPAGAEHAGPGIAGSAAASRPGLDILERRAPSPQPVPTRTAVQPNASQPSGALPARAAVDTVPAHESVPTALPASPAPAQPCPGQPCPGQLCSSRPSPCRADTRPTRAGGRRTVAGCASPGHTCRGRPSRLPRELTEHGARGGRRAGCRCPGQWDAPGCR